VIFGLAAALGWGLADFSGALAGRRIGSISAVIMGQLLSALFVSVLVVTTGQDVSRVMPLLGVVALNGAFAATAYASHYRALELGPVAVVSPIGAGFAVVGVGLAIVILGERPGPIELMGAGVTVLGVALVSTDLVALRSGTHTSAPGLTWAIVAAVTFGVGGFLLGYLAKELGWILGLWASRTAQIVCFVPLALARRREFQRIPTGGAVGITLALAAGAADILGVTTYSYGAENGFLSIVLAASAVFPLVAVVLSVWLLHERPVTNQYVGIALVVAGLLLLGFG
jgi:drug/metabolite transporter (DMT)-like permease